jgi:hypothetical protein
MIVLVAGVNGISGNGSGGAGGFGFGGGGGATTQQGGGGGGASGGNVAALDSGEGGTSHIAGFALSSEPIMVATCISSGDGNVIISFAPRPIPTLGQWGLILYF